jgi:hypothetical protein
LFTLNAFHKAEGVSQAYYVEILNSSGESVQRKRQALSVKQFLAEKSINEV